MSGPDAGGVEPPPLRSWPEGTVRTPLRATPLARPSLSPDTRALRAHFEAVRTRPRPPLENPHLEPRVTDAQRRAATPSAVLIGIVARDPEPTVIVTTRQESISFPGHVVFPGGRSDPGDATPVETALREAEEEIGLDRRRVEVLARLGDYVTHSGFRIAPVVGLVEPPVELEPHVGEVAAIHEVPLSQMLGPERYLLFRHGEYPDCAFFALEHDDLVIVGATASLCIALYAELLESPVIAAR